jgi:hypothetical protein
MPTPAEQSAERALGAYNDLVEAETFADARAAWEDFLTHWRRGLNRCDAEGTRSRRGSYVVSKSRVMADSALAYLWSARNAEEHGVAEIATLQERAIAIGAFGGYQEEEVERGPNGERTFRYTPLMDDPPPFFAVLPEHIKLVAVRDREKDVPVPKGYEYGLGETLAPVALAKVGLDFLLDEVANLAKLGPSAP